MIILCALFVNNLEELIEIEKFLVDNFGNVINLKFWHQPSRIDIKLTSIKDYNLLKLVYPNTYKMTTINNIAY